MRLIKRYAAMVMVFGFAVGAWSISALGQGPPPDDMDWMPKMGMGPGPGPGQPPPQRMGMGMRDGMHRPGRGDDRRGFSKRERFLEQVKKDDPQRFERLMKIKQLAQEYRETDSEKRKKEIDKQLRPLVNKELKTQHEENKKRVVKLEKKLKEMKKMLKQRDENWDQVVDYTVKEVTGQNEYLRAWKGGPKR